MDQFATARETGDESIPPSEFEALKADHQRLAGEVAQLRALVDRMAAELGIASDGPAQN
jgi:poly(3-hydroxybutyrate) depolymerase